MAIKRVDEFDGVTDAEIVEFSVEGVEYEIDLSESSKDRLYKDLDKYIKVARRKSPKRTSARKSTPTAHKPAQERGMDLDAIRAWARQNGMQVSDRGRIPKDIVAAFNEAHAPTSMFSA